MSAVDSFCGGDLVGDDAGPLMMTVADDFALDLTVSNVFSNPRVNFKVLEVIR